MRRRIRGWPAITRRQRRRRELWREICRVAQDDLDHVALSIAALESSVATVSGPARDSYYGAIGLHAQAAEQLVVAVTIADVRQVAALASRARHEIACARAWLDDDDPPPTSAPCFFDPAHGPARRDVVFAPGGGQMQQLAACAACAEEVDAGRAPPSRKVIVDGRPQSYWRSAPHAGYFGSRGDTLDDLLGPGNRLAAGNPIGLFDWLDDLIDLVGPR